MPNSNGFYDYTVAENAQSEAGRMKLLKRIRFDVFQCIVMWTCRQSREGVHVLCNQQNAMMSANVASEIKKIYAEDGGLRQPQLSRKTDCPVDTKNQC